MKFEIILEDGSTQNFETFKNSFILGRSKKAECRIVGEGISRKHLKIEKKDGKVFVEDLGSANGSFINNKKIEKNIAVELTTFFPVIIGKNITISLLSETDNSESIPSSFEEIRISPSIRNKKESNKNNSNDKTRQYNKNDQNKLLLKKNYSTRNHKSSNKFQQIIVIVIITLVAIFFLKPELLKKTPILKDFVHLKTKKNKYIKIKNKLKKIKKKFEIVKEYENLFNLEKCREDGLDQICVLLPKRYLKPVNRYIIGALIKAPKELVIIINIKDLLHFYKKNKNSNLSLKEVRKSHLLNFFFTSDIPKIIKKLNRFKLVTIIGVDLDKNGLFKATNILSAPPKKLPKISRSETKIYFKYYLIGKKKSMNKKIFKYFKEIL